MHKRIQRESSSWSHTCYGYETHSIQFWLFYKVYNLVPPSSFTMLCTVSVVYFQPFSSPQEQNVNHEKSLPILCPPPPLPWSIHSSTSCIYGFSSGQFSSVAQSCPTLWDPMKCSTSGHPVQQLPEFTQTHIHWLRDDIQLSHPRHPLPLLPSIFPSIRVFSNESVLCIRWPKYWSFSFSSNIFQWIFRTDFL